MKKNKTKDEYPQRDKLFEEICLTLLKSYYKNPVRISNQEIFELCEKAEEISEIIKTWETEK